MKKYITAVLISFSAVFLLAARGRKDVFSFEALEKKYPSSQYITGTGQGASLASASGAAKLSICQTLGESLKGQQNVQESSYSTGDQDSSLKISVNETVLYEHITGIEVKENYRTKSGEWICAAVLNKKDAEAYYSRLARENDSKISELVSRAVNSGASFESLELMNQAVRLAEDNQYNLDILLALTKKRPLMTYGTVQSVMLKAKDMAKEISVSITVNNDKDGQVLGAFVKYFSEKGISVVKEKALFLIRADISLENTQSPDQKNIFVRYILNAPVFDSSENTVKSFNINGREGHVTYEQAVQRCYKKICQRIEEEY